MQRSNRLWSSIAFCISVMTAPAIAHAQRPVEYRGLSAVDDNVAWASGSGGRYARSANGGQTWQLDSVPGAGTLFLVDVHARDAQVAWMLGTDFNGGYSAIYHTRDGGRSWSKQYEKRHAQVFLDGIAFWDDKTGVAFGDPVDGVFHIVRTEDGGATWTDVPSANIPAPLAGEAAFAASGTNITVLASGHAWFVTGGGPNARVFHSRDRGRTWNAYTTPLPGASTAGLFGIAMRDTLNGVAVGGDYEKRTESQRNVVQTRDGGRTWTLVGSSNPAGVRYGVAYSRGARSAVIATGPSGYGVSFDEGATWSAVDSAGYNTVATSPGRIWLAGTLGRVTSRTPDQLPVRPTDSPARNRDSGSAVQHAGDRVRLDRR